MLDTGRSTNVRIDHDGAFNCTFIRPNEIKRGALFTADMELIEHYVFPAISGGKVMTVIPANAAAKLAVLLRLLPSARLLSVTMLLLMAILKPTPFLSVVMQVV